MLRRVLLHMIAAAGSVDFAANASAGLHVLQRSFQIVDDVAVFSVGDFGDGELAIGRDDPSRVVDLAAAGGIESGAVENEPRTRRFNHRAHFGVEVVKEGIVVIEAVGHACFSIEMELRVIKSVLLL